MAAEGVKFTSMAAITNITWKTIVRPMRTTFATSLGSKTCVTSVIVTVACSDGSVGVGEIPTSFVLPHENVNAIRKVLVETKPFLLGKSVDEYAILTARLRKQYPDFHMTISGLEVAMFRAWLASQGISEIAFWGKIKHAHASVGMAPNNGNKIIETDITIPFVPQSKVLEPWIQRAIDKGFCTYKVKVSGHVKKDLQFCLGIHQLLAESGKSFTIRLDGNQGFTAKTALELLEKLEKASMDVELFEQPTQRDDYKAMKIVYKNSPVPIIADETVFCADDCRRVIDDRLAHGVNVKIAKSGISELFRIMRLARRAKLKLMIGCMTETMVGLSAGINLAAGTGAFDYIDLDSVHFLHARKRYGHITVCGCCYYPGK